MEPKLSRAKSAQSAPKHELVALYFKVPHRFRRWLKTQAALRNVTMTELLMAALLSYAKERSRQESVANPFDARLTTGPFE